jgi:hypothetical protein
MMLKERVSPAFTHTQTGRSWDIEAGEVTHFRSTESPMLESAESEFVEVG